MKKDMLYLFSIMTLFGCQQKEKTKPVVKEHFSYFELSYYNGWGKGFSFCVDSNKIFFLPDIYQSIDGNKIPYGLLPDSLYQSIDTFIYTIKKIKSQDPAITYCLDCAEVSVKTIIDIDTSRIYLAGDIDNSLWKLIEQLQGFKKSSHPHQLSAAYFYLETMQDVLPPPPSPVKQN